jgi:DNA processing protein
VAIVGGRRATPLRLAAAGSLATGLARAGWTVVSGGAVGVDAAAHRGALDGGGTTVAVLGSGLDVPYPLVNLGLLARIRATGTLLTEHPPGARPRPPNFIPRNRLIAALASAVVVVEAGARSGSLATARSAASRGHGRVLVVPGAPWDPGAAGCNELIRDGAQLVRGLDDILAELEPLTTGRAGSRGASDGAQPAPPALSEPARRVLAVLVDGTLVPPARVASLSGLGAGPAARAVLELELSGLARRTPSGIQMVALANGTPSA